MEYNVEEFDSLEDIGYCVNCVAEDGVIFLCDAGWYCEDCFRELANVSHEVSGDVLHDGINDGTMAPFIDLVKAKYYGEVGINNEIYPDDSGYLSKEEEAERVMFLQNLIDLTETWGLSSTEVTENNGN